MAVLGLGKKLPIGTKVRSIRIGRKAEFVGTIIGYAAHGAYNVADETGAGWHRERNEIAPITPSEPHEPPSSQAPGS